MMALNFCPPPPLQSWDYRHACPYPDHVMLGLEARASCTPRKHSTNSLIPSPQFPVSLASGDVQYFLANITSYLKTVFFSLKYFIYYPCVCTKKEIAAGLPLCSGTKIPEVFCKPLPCPQTWFAELEFCAFPQHFGKDPSKNGAGTLRCSSNWARKL